jgi:hypothetical protein
LASLKLTTYTLGLENKGLRINDGITTQTSSASSLSFMAIGVPFGTRGGLSFGLQPNTTVGYSLTEEFRDNEDNLTAINLFRGEGGTNRVFLGFGYKLNNKLSLGVEAAYVFGNIDNSLLNRRDGVQFSTMHKTESVVRGVATKIGILYRKEIKNKTILKAGAVINFNNDLTNKGKELLFSLINTDPSLINPRDTLVNKSFDSSIGIPVKTILSTGIGKENKWYAGVEYVFQNALNFSDAILNQSSFVSYDSSSRISVGGFYTPKFNSVSSYWQRLTYRAGIKYKQTGLMINNTGVNDFGISFGVGFPIGQQLSNFNLGFELGKRGKSSNGLIEEKYLNFRLSLTLNDKWFRKRTLE